MGAQHAAYKKMRRGRLGAFVVNALTSRWRWTTLTSVPATAVQRRWF
jgi:hypothetical protein